MNRLQDPRNLVSGAKLKELQDKLSECLARMARSTEKKGNPFFFSLAATKYHYLENAEGLGVKNWATAATDGISYFWCPEFLDKLDVNQIKIVQIHESMHVICRHVDRFEGKKIHLWRLATDFFVNASIENDLKNHGVYITKNNNEHPIWNGELGKPISLQELLDRMKKYHEDPKSFILNEKVNKNEKRCCADITLVGLSADDIYNKLYEQFKKYPPPPGNGYGEYSDEDGSPSDIEGFDEHIKIKLSKKEVLKQLLNAAESAKRMRGTIPSEIEEELKQLQEPELSWEDFCMQSLQKVKEKNGKLNDWTSFRRRSLSIGMYTPKKIQYNGKILVLLDTSGSVSDSDIVYLVSQLKVLEGHSGCWVVPVDAVPHWEGAVEVKKADDLKKVKIIGRGGTIFDEFFRDYQKKMGDKGPFDLIIVCTDGGYGTINKNLAPKCDVVWVHCNNYKPASIPFGNMAPLRKVRGNE